MGTEKILWMQCEHIARFLYCSKYHPSYTGDRDIGCRIGIMRRHPIVHMSDKSNNINGKPRMGECDMEVQLLLGR